MDSELFKSFKVFHLVFGSAVTFGCFAVGQQKLEKTDCWTRKNTGMNFDGSRKLFDFDFVLTIILPELLVSIFNFFCVLILFHAFFWKNNQYL